jgi:L-rhamnose mutarotase
MEIALHTVLTEGHEADYDAVHEVIPEAVARKLRAAGVRDWRIWRDGRHVFHLVDVEDYAAMRAALRDDPDNIAWQETVGPFFDQPDSYEGGDSGIARLWTLSDQLQDASRERP